MKTFKLLFFLYLSEFDILTKIQLLPPLTIEINIINILDPKIDTEQVILDYKRKYTNSSEGICKQFQHII